MLAALMLAASGGAALAVKAGPDTVQCNGNCQACIESEVAGDGTKRCVKCGIAPSCLGNPADPGLTSDFTEIVQKHNAYRATHCAPALTWSQQVATTAQQWANACTSNGQGGFAHDPQKTYGESLAWGQSLSGTGAVDLWYAENSKYKFADPEWNSSVGHFTQLVWKGSTQIGCGVASCGGQNFWVCRYSPPGNFNVSTQYVTADEAKKNLRANVGCENEGAAPAAANTPAGGGGGGNAPAGGGGGGNAPAGGKTATVNQDVDVYAAPGGNGNAIGTLNAGNSVTLLSACSDNWCNVQGAAVPTGKGWVYDGPDYDSLKY